MEALISKRSLEQAERLVLTPQAHPVFVLPKFYQNQGMATVVKMMVGTPSIHQWPGKPSGAAGLLIDQDRLASRNNFRAISSLTETSGIPNSIEEDSGRSAAALASSSALHFPGMLLCPETPTSEILKRPEIRARQRRHSLTILELFAKSRQDQFPATSGYIHT